jgi:hypothetical protein
MSGIDYPSMYAHLAARKKAALESGDMDTDNSDSDDPCKARESGGESDDADSEPDSESDESCWSDEPDPFEPDSEPASSNASSRISHNPDPELEDVDENQPEPGEEQQDKPETADSSDRGARDDVVGLGGGNLAQALRLSVKVLLCLPLAHTRQRIQCLGKIEETQQETKLQEHVVDFILPLATTDGNKWLDVRWVGSTERTEMRQEDFPQTPAWDDILKRAWENKTEWTSAEGGPVVEKLKFLRRDGTDMIFRTKYVGSDILAERSGKDFPKTKTWQDLLQSVFERGNGTKTRMTSAAGRVMTRSTAMLTRGGISKFQTGVCVGKRSFEIVSLSIRFKATDKYCVPYALLNVLRASSTKKHRLLKALNDLCGLNDLAGAATKALGVSLKKCPDKSLGWVLAQPTGKFLVLQGVHCVSVDCDKGHLLDCAQKHALTLCMGSFKRCKFTDPNPSEVRQVVL